MSNRQPPRRDVKVAGRTIALSVPIGAPAGDFASTVAVCENDIEILSGDDGSVLGSVNCDSGPFTCPPTGGGTGCVLQIDSFGFQGGSGLHDQASVTVFKDGISYSGSWVKIASPEITQWCPNCEATIQDTWTPSGSGSPPDIQIGPFGAALGPPANGANPAPGVYELEYVVTCDNVTAFSAIVNYIVQEI